MEIIKKASVFINVILSFILISSIDVYATETDNTDYSLLGQQIAEDVESYHIPAMALAVVDKDGVLYEQTFGKCETADEPFIIGSMSKSFTAIAIMQLHEQGKIDLDSPINKYIDTSEWFENNNEYGIITVKNLLNQTSGITTYQTFGSLKCTASYGSHVYANANYGLLGLIVESVSDMPYEEYIEKNIFEPLGMSHSAATLEKSKENGLIDGYRNYFGIPIAGEPDYPQKIQKGTWTNIPAGYLSSSLSDMEKYLQMYLNDGQTIISPESVNSMFYDNVPVDDGTCYGMGWNYVPNMFSKPMLMHAGLVENYTSNMFIIPEKGIAVVVLVNMNDYLVCNNLIGNIIAPLLGEEKQELPNLYVIFHIIIDTVYLLLFFIGIYSLATLKKWKTKAENKQLFVLDIIRHIIFPILLLSIPMIIGTPQKVLWLFVKDLSIVIITSAALLITVGVYKAVFLLKQR